MAAKQLLALLSLFYFGITFCESQQGISADVKSPYSVNLDETLLVEVVVTNNGRENATVDVTLDNAKNAFKSQDKSLTQTVLVPAGRQVTVIFHIVFIIVGPFKIVITLFGRAKLPLIITKDIIIKTQGLAIYSNNATLVELCETKEISYDVTILVPDDAVRYCTVIVVSVIGNVMGPSIDNLNNLIQIPSGCGEQLLISLVPNIVVIQYLELIGTLTPAKKAEAIGYIQIGYNKELTYRHPDGSYSAFLSDPNGSTWLTAYAAKTFFQAKAYIIVDTTVINSALAFIETKQTSTGEFVENGRIIHTSLQGGTTTSRCAMTAYIVIAFLVNGRTRTTSTVVNLAVTFLESNLPTLTDSYELSIVTYALHLAGSPLAENAFQTLLPLAIIQGDQKYWGPSAQPSLQIEATAYVLLVFAFRGDIVGSDPLVRWLVGKKNELGGYSSSQNTVIALEALAAVARIKKYCDTYISVTIKDETSAYNFTVNKENALVLQKQQLPDKTRKVNIYAQGTGVAVVQVSWHYCRPPRGYVSNSFLITVTVTPVRGAPGSFSITICVRYTVKGVKYSGMGIIEAQSQSGFIFGDENLKTAARDTITEIKGNNTAIYRYLPQFITEVEICVTFTVRRVVTVLNLQPAYVKVYDYYQPESEAIAFYQAPVEDGLITF